MVIILCCQDQVMDKLKLENLKLQKANKEMQDALKEMNDALRESTKLLLKTRPARPVIPHERKLLVAAQQGWKCLAHAGGGAHSFSRF